MNNIELLKMRESFNYDLAKGMIGVSKRTLDNLSNNYNAELDSMNGEIYRHISINLFLFLEENNLVTKGTQEILYSNAAELRGKLQEKTSELTQISSSLDKIMEEKMNHQLLEQIKQGGSTASIELDEYVDKTVNAGNILATSSFPNFEREINTYNKNIINDLKVEPDSQVAKKIQTLLNNYKRIYLYRLSRENKIMFGNFANLVSTTGIYLTNYAKSVDEILGYKNVSTDFDELGVPKERKSLTENLESARQLYMPEPKRMI